MNSIADNWYFYLAIFLIFGATMAWFKTVNKSSRSDSRKSNIKEKYVWKDGKFHKDTK